jgi:poly-gamma-glutamate synthesis protein (capsule biosynthesis protein)
MVRLRVSENSIETETIPVEIRNCVPTIVDHF